MSDPNTPEIKLSIEERLAQVESDLAVVKDAVVNHALWINWLKSMVSQRPEDIGRISEVP
jgi:hypothetical protein